MLSLHFGGDQFWEAGFELGVEKVRRDAETEDGSSEEGRGYAHTAEGDFQQEVCGGSGEASM